MTTHLALPRRRDAGPGCQRCGHLVISDGPNRCGHDPCCSSHWHRLCCACYRTTHFVEVGPCH